MVAKESVKLYYLNREERYIAIITEKNNEEYIFDEKGRECIKERMESEPKTEIQETEYEDILCRF
jgi:hypothetical protein